MAVCWIPFYVHRRPLVLARMRPVLIICVNMIDPDADIKIVPILVGGISEDQEREYGELLAPYFAREDTLVVVSSDFCHWYAFFFFFFSQLLSILPIIADLRRK